MNIGFWKTKTNNFCVSHHSGLTQEQIDEFQNLKVGSKLKLWISDKDTKYHPHFTLQVFKEDFSNASNQK
jgi:2'-5' RNA ligase